MGFGSIIAAMISVATILMASYVCSKGGFYMADGLTNSVIEMQENKNEILKTEIEITEAYTDKAGVKAFLKNTGSTKIGDFAYMDVIVACQSESGTVNTVWIPYQEDEVLSDNRWTKTEMNTVHDLINPGILDPGEEIELQIRLNTSNLPENSSVKWLLVAAPNGVKASWYFKDNLSI